MRLLERVYLVGSGEIGLSDAWDCHVYAVDGGDEIALIDAGGGRPQSYTRILENLAGDGLDPGRIRKLLLTHWHPDHARGAAGWRERLGVTVYLPEIERGYLETGEAGMPPCAVDVGVADGDRLQVGDLTLAALQVPGHSPGICAYLLDLPGRRMLFAADIVFFNGVIGLINHPGSDLATYRAHLPRLAGLGVDALLSGHLLFALRDGQRHIDRALGRMTKGFVPLSIGQLDVIFTPPDDY
jgi:glyoxylase-like metal-dependent hydrolase (beta-lactamase superfamily II)